MHAYACIRDVVGMCANAQRTYPKAGKPRSGKTNRKEDIFFLTKKDKTVTMQTLVSESIVVFFSFEQ